MDTLTRAGISLAFEDVGQGAPPVLLIHDLGADHTSMRAQVAHFRSRHRVVAVDLRGRGASGAGSGGGGAEGCTPGDYADDVAWLCYELGVYRPVAVGRGSGGLVASALAAQRPDLLAGVVLVLRDESDHTVNATIEAFLAAYQRGPVAAALARSA